MYQWFFAAKKLFWYVKKNTITCLFFLWEVNCFVVFEPFARIYHPENWNLFFYYFGSKIQIFFSISWNSIGLLENSNQVNWKKLSKMLNFGFPQISWRKKFHFYFSVIVAQETPDKKNRVYVLRCCRHLSISWEVLLSKKFFWENAEQLLEFSTEAKGKTLGAKESFERILSKKCPQHELRHGWYWFQPQLQQS